MNSESPVVITSSLQEPIFGILHEPADPLEPRVGIHLLNPGLKYRVAPNRLNVILGRRLADLGYYVLRTDPPGIGDSGGDLPESTFPDLWQRVQRGEFVTAIREVNRMFAEQCMLDEIVGMGNCGGAITALLEAASNPLVHRLVLIDIPVTLQDADPRAATRIMGAEHGSKILRSYLRRMKDWRAWGRLLTFRSDGRMITGALRARLFGKTKTMQSRRHDNRPAADATGTGPGGQQGEMEGLSALFATALREFHGKGGRALFAQAGENADTFIFNDLVGKTFMAPGTELARRHERVLIPGANHIYGTFAWRAALIDVIEGWLEGNGKGGMS